MTTTDRPAPAMFGGDAWDLDTLCETCGQRFTVVLSVDPYRLAPESLARVLDRAHAPKCSLKAPGT